MTSAYFCFTLTNEKKRNNRRGTLLNRNLLNSILDSFIQIIPGSFLGLKLRLDSA